MVDRRRSRRCRPWPGRCRARGAPARRVASSLGLELLLQRREGLPVGLELGHAGLELRAAVSCSAFSLSALLASCCRLRKLASSACARASMLSVWASCSARNSRRRRERSRAHCTLSDWNACTVALTIRWAVTGIARGVADVDDVGLGPRGVTSRPPSSPSMAGSRAADAEGGGLDRRARAARRTGPRRD